jgi:hypothetical protein
VVYVVRSGEGKSCGNLADRSTTCDSRVFAASATKGSLATGVIQEAGKNVAWPKQIRVPDNLYDIVGISKPSFRAARLEPLYRLLGTSWTSPAWTCQQQSVSLVHFTIVEGERYLQLKCRTRGQLVLMTAERNDGLTNLKPRQWISKAILNSAGS